VLVAVKVSVLLLFVGVGRKEALIPLGSPVTESWTLPVNPLTGLT
jgi:hypothetical protein